MPLTSLVGRADDIAAAAAALGAHRLVTLFGPGGAGKTRLAQHVAAEVVDTHRAGAWWVELMPVTDPADVAAAVVAALPSAEMQGANAQSQLVDLIGQGDHLLVLDNCEHVVGAAADLVSALLGACPNVRVLTTSRELLDVPGELPVAVAPLASPRGGTGPPPDLTAFDATRLFLERATSLELDGTRDQVDAIAQICRALDGLPLAVELAAARTRLLSVQQIAAGLDDRFSLLASAGRTAAGHQHTLEASIAWSFDLLDPDERDLLMRLAVFPGPFDLDAATVVGRHGDRSVDLLGSLVDKSLLTVRTDGPVHTYRLLESIRVYGMQLLDAAGAVAAARDAHLEFALARANQIGLRLLTSLGSKSMRQARAFIDDARAADAWAHASGVPEQVVNLHWPLMLFHQVSETTADVVESLEAAVRSPRLDVDQQARAHAMLVGLPGQSAVYGDVVLARERIPDAIRLARRNGDPVVLFVALSGASFAEAWSCGDGTAHAREALEVASGIGAPMLDHIGSTYLSLALFYAGRGAEAYDVSAAAATRLEEAGIGGSFLGLVRTVAASSRLLLGPMSELDEEIEQVRRVTSFGGLSRHAVVNSLLLPYTHIAAGQAEEAVAHAERTLRDAPTDGTLARAAALLGRAIIHEAMGETDDMLDCSQAAEAAFEGRWNGLWLHMSRAMVALAHAQRGDVAIAAPLVQDLQAVVPDAGFFIVHGTVAMTACLIAQDHDPAAAVGMWLDQAHREVAAGMLTWNLRTLGYTAVALVDAERPADAMTLLGACASQQERLETRHIGTWHAPLEAAEARARRQLDPTEADERHAAGAAMTIEEVLGWLRRGRGPRRRALAGWEAITDAEQAVIDKVVTGMSNAEVAAALFVTTNTVKSHLSSVYRKLDVHSRAALTAAALGRGDALDDEPGASVAR